MKNRSSGFTLIELIVVMAIIMILVGLTTGAAMKAKQRALVAQAKTMISGLETAIGMFQMDLGGYPNSTSTNLYTCLVVGSGGAYTVGTFTALNPTTSAGWSGPYMNFKVGEASSAGGILDPYGKAYTYTNPGATAHNFGGYVDIYSWGPNKADNAGAGDDITNWTR